MSKGKDIYCAGQNSTGFCPMRLSCARYILNQPCTNRHELHLFDSAPYELERTYCLFYKVKQK